MDVHLFAGLRVRDFSTARAWYERLFGDPSFYPHETEAVWTLAENRSIYIVEAPARVGNGVVTLFVEDLDTQVANIAARGLDPAGYEVYSSGARKAVYRDPDGNEIGFAGSSANTAE